MNEKVLDERKVEELTQILKKITMAVVLFSIVGVVYLFISRGQEKKEQEAFALLFVAEQAERKLGETTNPFEAKFYKELNAWDAEKKAQYSASLNKVLEVYPTSEAAHLARLRLARLFVLDNKHSDAEELLLVVRKESSEDFVVAQALQVLAVMYEDQGAQDKALNTFEQIISIKKAPFRPVAYMGKARVLKNLKRNDEARTVYEEVTKEFPNSVFEKQARALMAIGG